MTQATGRSKLPAYRGDQPFLFVCYAHEDADWVISEIAWLRDRGARIWYDEGIHGGVAWTNELAESISKCSGFLFFASEASVASQHVLNEIQFAIDADKPFLAVHFEETALPPGLRLLIGWRQAIIRGDLSMASYRQKLLDALSSMDVGIERELGGVDVSQPIPGFEGRTPIAVLPFRNLSGSSEYDYIAEGLTEELVVGIQTLRNFPVISRQSTAGYASEIDTRRLSRELGVGFAVRGSVRISDDRIRITAQLIDAKSDLQIWADRFEGKREDVFALQDQITQEIIGAIEPHVIHAEIDRSQRLSPQDMASWDLFLKGQEHFSKASYEGFVEARRCWTRAVEIEPTFAHPWAGLAGIEIYMLLHHRAQLSDEEARASLERLRSCSEKALELDPNHFIAHMAYSAYFVHAQDAERAIEHAGRSVECCPGSSQSHANMGFVLYRCGQFEEALRSFEVAKRLSPADPNMWQMLTQESACYYSLGRFEESLHHARQAIGLNHQILWPHFFRTVSLQALGRVDEARAALEQMLAEVPDFSDAQLAELPEEMGSAFRAALREVGWEG